MACIVEKRSVCVFSGIGSDRAETTEERRALVAGDSNVHRLGPANSSIKCLPVSGARYVRDRKDFRNRLLREIRKISYNRLYLHLGSNDVLSKEDVFYKNVTEVCDMVHEACPLMEIVLCEILPRRDDSRSGLQFRTSSRKIKEYQRWISRMNNMLWELSQHVPYLNFLSYGKVAGCLSNDGLHLSLQGGKGCSDVITEDFEVTSIECVESEQIADVEEWPALVNDSTIEPNMDYRTPFADVVRELSSDDFLQGSDIDIEEAATDTSEKASKKVYVKCRTRKRFSRRKVLRLRAKQGRRKFHARRPHCSTDFIQIDLMNGFAVEVQAYKLHGSCMKKDAKVPTETTRVYEAVGQMDQCDKAKKTQEMLWLPCPECKVKCSREDFLLDHIIRRHVNRSASSMDEAKTPSNSHTELPTQADEKSSEDQNATSTPNIRSPATCEETLLVQQNVNTSKMRLLLSNDVEQNPGPTFTCQWEGCGMMCESAGLLNLHLVRHAVVEDRCHWQGCIGYSKKDLKTFELHILHHLYDNLDFFPSVNDWLATLPGGKINNDSTNLQFCPKHLRSRLHLLLFDEDFDIKQHTYTVNDHQRYLDFLSIHSDFIQTRKEFISKRSAKGETWEQFLDSDVIENVVEPSTSSQSLNHIQREFYTVRKESKYEFVNTSRPELVSNLFSGTKLHADVRPTKRKYVDLSHSQGSSDQTWLEHLKENLSSCSTALFLQDSLLQALLDKSIISPNQQSFFKLEQETAKLAAINNCSNGTFCCTVFKCNINEKDFFYVRYVESGVYRGFMLQQYLILLRQRYGFTDENILLHNTLTTEDIDLMKTEQNRKDLKRNRPDKIFKHSIEKILPLQINELKQIEECPEVNVLSYMIHCLPYKSKVSVDRPEKMFLEMKSLGINENIHTVLLDFRLNKLEPSQVSSKDILNETTSTSMSLLQQSIKINCLSGNIKRNPHLFIKTARFPSNFVHNDVSSLGTSLRNHTSYLFQKKDFFALASFYRKYFPELNNNTDLNLEVEPQPVTKRRKPARSVKPIHVSKSNLEKQFPAAKDNSLFKQMTLFDGFCCSLLDHGKLAIQYFEVGGPMVCCINEYSETDGSFKSNDFVYTIRLRQESGDYFFCSCSIYRTLINMQEYKVQANEFVVLDSAGDNCVTCMHCKFVQQKVLPNIESGNNMQETRMQRFVQKALDENGKELIELSRNGDTRKYSILLEGDDYPAFVYLTFIKKFGRYIISCTDGKCRAMRGHKRNLNTLLSSSVCKHLSVLKMHQECWLDLIEVDNDNSNIETDPENILNDEAVTTEAYTDSEDFNFNEQTGLWKFKCKSSHPPCKKDSAQLKLNVLERDQWNDYKLKRQDDGCLKGPILVVDIPDNTCDCGRGWLKREDDDNYNANGLTMHQNSRILTVYTQTAPVKCEVHIRLCYNETEPCKISWNEGQIESLHVFSRDTAAGDEIGWEFVSMVINSGCTFSSFCQLKNETYKIRDSKAKFMDRTVFINWWFSWAASMKIDFRNPCSVCGYEPKRLCCDGTKVGVGFRNANYEEINKVDQIGVLNQTLHRRMDRCFLKNMNGLDKQQMIKNRSTLDYLARKEVGLIKPDEIIPDEELNGRINSVKQVLPEEILASFERFFIMSEGEKHAYSYVLKMLATTASVTSLISPSYAPKLQHFLNNPDIEIDQFNFMMNEMRSYAPELRDLISESMICNNEILHDDIRLFLQYLINESLTMEITDAEPAMPQPGTYNPEKYGRAYYFNESGSKLRNIRKFTIDNDNNVRRNVDHDDATMEFERCQKLFSKVQTSAPGTSTLFLWFCADHGHCYGFHMTGAEGRKDPAASLYSHLEKPPQDIFYDFACNLQEYCLNRESGYYKCVRFFHDIFHSYAHKCSCAFKSSRLQGFESINSEICEQFNSFIQCIKRSARQMSQSHFCFYLQFFLHEWNERKRIAYSKKIRIALAGLV